MSRNKGINKLVVSDDTTPSLQELPVLASETLGVFVHSTNSTVPSKLFLSQGTSTQASFSRIEFDTDSGLGIFTDVPFVSSHDASIKFKARGTDYWKIEGVDGSSGDLLPLINNQLKIGRSGFNLAETFSRKITSDSTLALAAGGATKWNLDSGGNLIPSTANSQNFGATSTALSQIFGNQLNSGTGQALYLGSNGGAYQWRIANGTNAAFIPNSTYDIGASGSRVGKLWGTDIDITGTINSGGFSSSGDVITNSIRTIGTSDNLVIKTGTGFAEKVRITSEGNVGIRTSNPICALDVQGVVRIGDSASSNFRIDLGSTGVGTYRSAYVEGLNNDILFANQQNGNLRFYTYNTEKMRITPTGKVGIGTTSPYATLDVNSSLQIGSSATSSNNFHITAESIGALQFWNGNYGTGTELMRITSGGNVGIGTTTPTYKLDVRGTIRIGNASSSVFGIDFGTTGVGTYRSAYLFGDGSNVIFSNQQNGYFALHTENGERMRITSDGMYVTGDVTANRFFGTLRKNAPAGSTTTLIDANMAGTDFARMLVGGSEDSGYLEIATSDNGSSASLGLAEPIHVRQYNGPDWSVLARTFTILDGYGNTIAPGSITANGFLGNATSATTATSATYLNTAASSSTKDNITTRTNSGFWETSTATTAEGWPETTNAWYHLLCSTHSNAENYYSMQFAGRFDNTNDPSNPTLQNDALFYRVTTNNGNKTWNRIWHSGNDSLLGTASNVASTIVRRDASGDFSAGTITAGTILTGAGGIEINSIGTGDRISYIDFHSQDGTDHDARIIREPGPNGNLVISKLGTGSTILSTPTTQIEVLSTGTTENSAGVKFVSILPPIPGDNNVEHDYGIIKGEGRNVDAKMIIYANRGNGGIEFRTNRPGVGEQPALSLDKTGISWFHNDIRHDVEEGTKPNIGASGGAGFNNIYAVNFVNTSDLRLKQNIEKIEDAQNIIMQLNPVKFDWKNKTKQVKNSGFIAQEVHKLIPECVISGDDEVEIQEAWGISMNHVIPYLTKALQEAFQEIQKLKERIEILES